MKYIYDRAYILYNNEYPIRIIGAMQDITERREAEIQLKQSEANINAIFENSSEGFILVNKFNKVISFNSKARDFNALNSKVNTSLEINKNILEHVEEERRDIYNSFISKVLQGETITYDIAYTSDVGTKTWINFLLQPVKSEDAIAGFCITGRDVTKQKIAEQLRDFERNNLKALINNTDDFIWSVDTKYQLITSNKAFDDIHARLGKTFSLSENTVDERFSDWGKDLIKKYYDRALGGESFTEILPVVLPQKGWFELSFYPILKVSRWQV